jgi:hypothetical protein
MFKLLTLVPRFYRGSYCGEEFGTVSVDYDILWFGKMYQVNFPIVKLRK